MTPGKEFDNKRCDISLILIGFMGSGKSTLGRALSRQWNCPFYDLDATIEAREQCRIKEIFQQHGEDYFRHAETAALNELLKSCGIIATGGGVITQERNRRLLQQSPATVVYLRAGVETLAQRIRLQPGVRPLIDRDGHPLSLTETQARVAEILAGRAAFYEECANLIIDTDQMRSIPEAIAVIEAKVLAATAK